MSGIALRRRLGYNVICVMAALALLCAPAGALGDAPSSPEPDAYIPWLLDVARAEIGYTEEPGGFTKYGRWAGDPGAQWCAEFLCWCVDQVDLAHGTSLLETAFPLYSGSNTGRTWFIRHARYVSRTGKIDDYGEQWLYGRNEPLQKNEYVPEPGDYMFFTFTANRDTDHVALVESAERRDGEVYVTVIEGNNPDSVRRAVYVLSDWRILGYGTAREVAGAALRRGCEGKWVLDLQNDLCLLGYLQTESADGRYGTNTIAAVKAFQRTVPLKETGVADMATQKALMNAVKRHYDSQPDVWLVVDSPEPQEGDGDDA